MIKEMIMFRNLFLLLSLYLASLTTLAADCRPTESMTSGTHFKPVQQKKTDVGKGLLVSGRILAAPDCKPVSNARIEHWQANDEGVYVDELRAYLLSDIDGNYRFNTEWPAAFVPHIHFRVIADGYKLLGTQWVGNERTDKIHFDMVLTPVK
jgi:protocatechuate 3,4-dioxygenase beta subunit